MLFDKSVPRSSFLREWFVKALRTVPVQQRRQCDVDVSERSNGEIANENHDRGHHQRHDIAVAEHRDQLKEHTDKAGETSPYRIDILSCDIHGYRFEELC